MPENLGNDEITAYERALDVLTDLFAPRPDSDFKGAEGRAQSVMAALANAKLRVVEAD